MLGLLAALSIAAHAQGTRADYERAMSLSKRFANTVFRQSVTPRWLPGNNAFWYRINTAPDRFEFVFVDALKGERRAAFDHRKLAEALARELKTEVRVDALPFTWIQPAPDGAWVRFRAGDRVWQFERDGSLRPSTEPLHEEKLVPMEQVRPSRNGGGATAVTFANRTETEVTLSWIDTEGAAKSYGSVKPGGFHRQNTYAGHVWKVTDAQGKTLGVYRATEEEAQAVIGDSKEGNATDKPKPHTEPVTPPELKIEGAKAVPHPQTFVRDFNLWLREQGGRETPLTTDGMADNFYRGPRASPDGRYVVASQVKPAQEHKVYMVESSPADQVQPKLKTIDYLKPGDRIEQERPRLFDLQAKREVPTGDTLFANPWSINELGWNQDGQKFRFLFNERGHQNLRLLEIDTTGAVRALVEEHSDTFIDYSQKTYFRLMDRSHELLWMSERDGWNHLYLYDTQNARLKNQITTGPWVVRSVERVDEEKRQIWFRALGIRPGQDPYYGHLGRVNFDGSGLQVLTEGDGTHSYRFSPDNRFFVDTYSRVDQAPTTELRDAASGKLICSLETADIKRLVDAGWTLPERFAAPGRDAQTPIHGIIIRPSNFDAAKKYPVIEQIYAGPQDFFVPKAFDTLNGMHELAELGFIVVQIDGMGTNWRSKAFHDVCWKNLKDAGFPDRIAWLKSAAQTRPWMDLSRVGIYGGSAGGQNALGALLFHGDFYKAAAADCGCHDNRMDKIWWNEAWMGWPLGPEYEDNSNVTHAKNLQGALLLIVGELDTNVDPASTMQVVNALIKANKDFDLLVVPGAGHGAGGSPYGTRRQRDFFVRHLLGVEPRS